MRDPAKEITKAFLGLASNKKLPNASGNNKIYRWDYYYNAPYQYLNTSGAELSAYDVLTSTSITTPNYKTYRQYEEERNEAKRQLRVLRSEYIRQFSEQYYDTLLS